MEKSHIILVTKYCYHDNIETVWEKHVECVGDIIVVGQPEGKEDMGNLRVEGRIVLFIVECAYSRLYPLHCLAHNGGSL